MARPFTVLLRLVLAGAVLCALAMPAVALTPDKPFHMYVHDRWSIEQGLAQITVSALTQDRDGYLWFGTQLGLSRFDGVRFMPFGPRNLDGFPGEIVQALAAAPEGGIYVGTYKGLALLRDGEVQVIEPTDGEPIDVQALLVGDDGSLIVGTQRGVLRAVNGWLETEPGLTAPANALVHDGRRLWIASRDGVYRVDDGATPAHESLTALAGAATLRVLSLALDGERLWAGTDAGLFLREDGRWRAVNVPREIASTPVHLVYRDREANVWIGALSGLARARDGRIVEFVPRGTLGSVPDYRSAIEDHEGNLWFGSRGDGVQRIWNGWTRRYSRPEGLQEPLVWSLARDGRGRTWVGTDNGLSLLEQGRFRRVVSGDALPHPNAYTLALDRGLLWIGTRAGLALYRPGSGLIDPGDRYRPLMRPQINGIHRDRDGTLWFATTDGVYADRADALQHSDLGGAVARVLLEDRSGTLWVGTSRGLWRHDPGGFVPVAEIEDGLPGDSDILSLHQRPNGDLVAATMSARLLLRRDGRWRVFDHATGLYDNPAFYIGETGDGWLWLGGMSGITRVRIADLYRLWDGELDQLTSESILNDRGARFSGQKGYCCNGAGNAKGMRLGNELWLPTRDGIVVLDSRNIEKNPIPPAIHVERYRYGSQWRLPPQDGERLRLPRGERDVSFEFTALSYQDPLSVRMRTLLRGYDQDWTLLEDPTRRSARYTNLPPGDYSFEVQAANNAERWNPETVRFSFTVPPYFFETLIFRVILLSTALLGVAALLRWRTLAGERQRRHLEELVDRRTEALAELNKQLRAASATDPLTGLANRRAVEEQIALDLRSAGGRTGVRGANAAMLLVLVDLDHFKQINDRHGHAAGDRVLIELSQLLSAQRNGAASVASPSQLARWGGEEFLLVYFPLDRQLVIAVVEALSRTINQHRFSLPDGRELRLTASLGFAEVPARNGDAAKIQWEHWLELADYALYDAKDSGRARWAGFRITRDTRIDAVQSGARPPIARLVSEGQLLFVRA